MSTTRMFEVGDVLRYKDVVEVGDENARFEVLENNGDRLLLRMLGFEGWRIQPTCVRATADLVKE